MPAVSVIIPIYNSASYIKRCAKSLMDQTLSDVEYIFIDDGSKDSSLALLTQVIDQYPEKKSNIKIISRENKGVGFTRNQGLQLAVGEYTIHLDSDDWARPEWLESMYSNAKSNCSDIVICDYSIEISNSYRYQSQRLGSDHDVIKKLLSGNLHGFLWNKLVKSELYKNNGLLINENINYLEDFEFIIKAFLLSKKISYVHEDLVIYNKNNESSITTNIDMKKVKEVVNAIESIEIFLEESDLLEKYNKELSLFKLHQKLWFIYNFRDDIPSGVMDLFPSANIFIHQLDKSFFYRLILMLSKVKSKNGIKICYFLKGYLVNLLKFKNRFSS